MPELILIVDDSRELRATVSEALAEEAYSTVAKGDGSAALAYLRSGARPAIILLDLMMPGMGGARFREYQSKSGGVDTVSSCVDPP
jgi:CheY-like chemotaxis protein